MEKNRADVVICGANYVLSSEKSEERIKEIAKMVDEEIRTVSKALNSNPNYRAAVLASLNIAEKLMDQSDMTLKLQTENYQLDNDVKHYIQMWEQTKKQVTDLKEKVSSEAGKQTQNSEEQKKLAAMGWHCITIWECELTPKKREETLESIAFTLNHIYLQDRRLIEPRISRITRIGVEQDNNGISYPQWDDEDMQMPMAAEELTVQD